MIRRSWQGIVPLLQRWSRVWIVLVVCGSLLAGGLEAMLLVLVVSAALAVADGASVVELALPFFGERQLTTGTALSVAAASGGAVLANHLLVAFLTARVAAGVLGAARARALQAFTRASWSRQEQDREGALQETVSSLVTQVAELVLRLSHFLSAAIALGMLLLAALIVDPTVSAVVLAVGITLFGALRPVSRLTRARARDYVERNSTFNEQVTQWGGLAMELRVFGVESTELARLARHNRGTAAAMAKSRYATRAGADIYRDLAILSMVVAVLVLNQVEVELAAVGSVVLLIIRSLSYAQMTNAAAQSVNEIGPNLDAYYERVVSLERRSVTAGHRPLDTVRTIRLQDVGYEYEPGRPALHDISLELAAGEAIGVIGPSGGGKSTLVQILLRLRTPTRGTVTVSDIPYEEIDAVSWSNLVSLVPQEPKLFKGTVADNIAFFRSGVTRSQIEDAAAKAHVLDDIRRLPQAFDTELGPRGSGLSGGQKQRVTIARALLGNPQLLVLDEPTSALDVRSEQLLQRTIEDLRGQVTLVIVAHRLSTLSSCDRVVALADGRVRVVGTLDEALAHVSFGDGIGEHGTPVDDGELAVEGSN